MTKQFALKADDKYDARFLHFRSTPWDGMSKKRTNDNRVDTAYGGMTVAYNPLLIVRKDGGIGVCVEVGVAICSGHDRYVKAIGRNIALNNLNAPDQQSYALIYLGEGDTIEGMLKLNKPRIPLIFNASGDLYIDERHFDLRGSIADHLGFTGY